jgi:uncharacterized membrane protein HdeD (DUF308 family)
MFFNDFKQAANDLTDGWWALLLAGIAWLIVSVLVLRMDLTSVRTVGVLLGVLFLVSGIEEFVIAMYRDSWRFLRVLMGVLFIGGAVWCFVSPFDAFWSLAAALGILLVINGAFAIAYSASTSAVNTIWWLGLVAGILEIGLGFWASEQYIKTRAVLLIVWVGLYAIFRGITDIVWAFELESVRSKVK